MATKESEGYGRNMVAAVATVDACIPHKRSRCDGLSEQSRRHRLIDQLALIEDK